MPTMVPETTLLAAPFGLSAGFSTSSSLAGSSLANAPIGRLLAGRLRSGSGSVCRLDRGLHSLDLRLDIVVGLPIGIPAVHLVGHGLRLGIERHAVLASHLVGGVAVHAHVHDHLVLGEIHAGRVRVPHLVEHARCARLVPAPDGVPVIIVVVRADVDNVFEDPEVVGLFGEGHGALRVRAISQVELEEVAILDGGEREDAILDVSALARGVQHRVGFRLVGDPLERAASAFGVRGDLEVLGRAGVEDAPLVVGLEAGERRFVRGEANDGALVVLARFILIIV